MHCTSDVLPDEWADTLDAASVEKIQQLRERLALHRITEAELLGLGLLLGNALVPRSIQRPLLQHLANATRRVRLRIVTHDAALGALPWEYVRLPSEFDDLGGSPLALDDRVSLVRSAAQGPPATTPVPRGSGELRVLHASATEVDGFDRLRGDDHAVDQALWGESARRTQRVVVDRLSDPATRSSLDEALRAGPDLLVFTGHATVDDSGRSALVLAAPDGSTDLLGGGELAAMLLRAGTHLVVLNGCDTATSGEASTSLTEMLVRSGVETVVGMQMPISDSNAGHFAIGMIGALGEGHPVDSAVAQGRKRIADRAGYAEWGIPTLMTSAHQAEPAVPEDALTRRPADPLVPVVSRGGTMTPTRSTAAPDGPPAPGRPGPDRRRTALLAAALVVLVLVLAFGWIQASDDDEPRPTEAPTSTTAQPWYDGVFDANSINDPAWSDTSAALRARVDAFQDRTAFPTVKELGHAQELADAQDELPTPPARLGYRATNTETNDECGRVELNDLLAVGNTGRAWIGSAQGVVVKAMQFEDDTTAQKYFWASSLFLGVRQGQCDGWPEDRVAVDPDELEVTRRDFAVAGSPDDWMTTVTRDAELNGVRVKLAHSALVRLDDVVVLATVWSLNDTLDPTGATQVINEVLATFSAA